LPCLKLKISFSNIRKYYFSRVVAPVYRVVALVDALDLLLQLLLTTGDLDLDVVDVFGDALDVEEVGSIGGTVLLLSVVDDVFMVSDHLVDLGQGI
jgi:hypothetical protein